VDWKRAQDPMRRLPDWRVTLPLARAAPRCGAKTRAGGSCKQPAMPNRRCRMHGGASTGPRTAEGLERVRTARTTHGLRTAEMARLRKMLRILRHEQRRVLELVK
jgi:hypothetical protein